MEVGLNIYLGNVEVGLNIFGKCGGGIKKNMRNLGHVAVDIELSFGQQIASFLGKSKKMD